MLKSVVFVAFWAIAIFPFTAGADEPATNHDAPEWFVEEIEFLARDGGRWITSNAEYQNEQEPISAFGTEWIAGRSASLRGRLFAIEEGQEGATFWEFFQYWDPDRQRVVTTQFGSGNVIGVGTSWQEKDVTKAQQAFYGTNGTFHVGHESSMPSPDEHLTESFDIVDGEWRKRRIYLWQRQRENTDN